MTSKVFGVCETGNCYQVVAEGNVYGLVCDSESEAGAWAEALNGAYEAGVETGRCECVESSQQERQRPADDCAMCTNRRFKPDCHAWRHTALSSRCDNFLDRKEFGNTSPLLAREAGGESKDGE